VSLISFVAAQYASIPPCIGIGWRAIDKVTPRNNMNSSGFNSDCDKAVNLALVNGIIASRIKRMGNINLK
jgi:hypothetical protein